MNIIEEYNNMCDRYTLLLSNYFFGYLSCNEYLKYIDELKNDFNILKEEINKINDKEFLNYVERINKILSFIPSSFEECVIIRKLIEYDFITDICIDIDCIHNDKLLNFIDNISLNKELVREIYSKLNIEYNNQELIEIMNKEIKIKERYIMNKSIDLCIYTGGILYSFIHIISTSYNDIEIKHPLVASLIPCIFFFLSILELSKISDSKNIINECNEKIKKLK